MPGPIGDLAREMGTEQAAAALGVSTRTLRAWAHNPERVQGPARLLLDQLINQRAKETGHEVE